LIRQLVSAELGIAADLKTDPMTAVAIVQLIIAKPPMGQR